MAGITQMRHLRKSITALGGLAVALVLSGCQPTLDISTVIADRIAQANFAYGNKVLLSGQNYQASVAVNGSNVYVLYFDATARKLRIVKSPDGGKTWNSPFTVDNTTDFYNTCNNLVVDQDHIYIVYWASRSSTDTDFFVELTDTGSSFTASNFQAISTYSTYPYGYENSIAYDNTNVYIVYSAGGTPAYTFAAKGASMTFLAQPKPIDSAFPNPGVSDGNRKPSSIYADGTNVNVSYSDNVLNRLRIASFLPSGSSLPMTVSDLNIGGAASTDSPSLSMAGPTLDAYYDGTAKSLRCYTHYTYIGPPPFYMLFIVSKAITVDSSSSNVGLGPKLLFATSNSTAYIAYYDAANKQLKFATGQQDHTLTPPDFVFRPSVVASVGGSNFDCSLATDGSALYIVYFDSASGGALRIAKSADGGVTW